MKFCEVSLTALVVTHTHVTSPRTGQDGARSRDSPSSEMSRRHLALLWLEDTCLMAAARVDKY